MTAGELEKELWTAANAITAFNALQVITALYALSKGDFTDLIKSHPHFAPALVLGGLICGLAYSLAIWHCWSMARRLHPAHREIWKEATLARVCAVFFFQAVGFVGIRILGYI